MTRFSAASAKHLVLILLSVASLYPVWFIVQTALKTPDAYTKDPTGLPHAPTLSNFGDVFRVMSFGRWTVNSVLVTVIAVAVAMLLAIFAAYAVAFGDFFGARAFLNVNISLMALPPVALVVPLFTVMVNVGLINTLPSVMLVYAGLLVPFSVFFLVNFFRELPGELIEAALMDGASHVRILFKIVIPLSAASMFTLIIVNAIWVWNELLFALVLLQNDNQRTVMAGLALSQGRYATNEPLVMAGGFLAIVPLLLLYAAGQRFFVRGLTAGIGK